VPCSVLAVGSPLYSGLITCTCSRNLLEWTVRHRLAAYSNIRFLDDCQVLGLLSNASKTSVTGVVRHYNYPQQNPSATEEALQANLVVDASGRNSQAPQWLEARPTSGDSDQLFFLLPVAGIGVRLVSGLSGRL